MMNITFGDNVRILSSPETDERGLAGKEGQVHGETTPSVTLVEVIGEVKNDYAINVSIDGMDSELWFAPELLELVDNAGVPGTVIGTNRAVVGPTETGNKPVPIPTKKGCRS